MFVDGSWKVRPPMPHRAAAACCAMSAASRSVGSAERISSGGADAATPASRSHDTSCTHAGAGAGAGAAGGDAVDGTAIAVEGSIHRVSLLTGSQTYARPVEV